MKARVLAVNWHDQQPVYSLDFLNRDTLVTSGGDKEVRVGLTSDGSPDVQFLETLASHSKAVNCVRFSPSGALLATGGDGGELSVWKLESAETQQTTTTAWKRLCMLRGHADDVQDVAWAPDSSALVSGSVENCCIIWDVEHGKGRRRLDEHRHFVQGVAWHPLDCTLVSLSCDRTGRVYGPKALKECAREQPAAKWAADVTCLHVLSRIAGAAATADKQATPGGVPEGCQEPGANPAPSHKVGRRQMLFHDETLSTFFRRPAWSPDGSTLIMPSGVYQRDRDSAQGHTAHVYSSANWASPLFHLPASKPVVAVAFSPMLYKLRQPHKLDNPAFNLPYRMVFALATLDSVIIYDTQAVLPLAMLGSLHLDRITDLAWSTDGQLLAVSSYDGFCSIASFSTDEFGEVMRKEEAPEHLQACLAVATKTKAPALPGRTAWQSGDKAQAAAAHPATFVSSPAGDGPQSQHHPLQQSGTTAVPAAAIDTAVPPPRTDIKPTRRIVPSAVEPSAAVAPFATPNPLRRDLSSGQTEEAIAQKSAKDVNQQDIPTASLTHTGMATPKTRLNSDATERPAKQLRRIQPQACMASQPAAQPQNEPAASLPVLQGGMSIAALAAAAGMQAAQALPEF